MLQWLVALLFAGVLTRLFRWALKKQRPRFVWRYGPHGFALVTAVALSALGGVGGASPGMTGLIAGLMLYVPAQAFWLVYEWFRPNDKTTGLHFGALPGDVPLK